MKFGRSHIFEHTAAGRRLLRRNFGLIGLNQFLGGFNLYFSIAIIYYAHITGSYAQAMMVFSFSAIAAFIFEIPTGVLSDTWGRRKTLIVGCIFDFAAVFSFWLGGTLSWEYAYLLLYLGGCFRGLGNALFSGNNYALLYETARSLKQTHRIGHILGKTNSMEQLGLVASGIIAFGLIWFGAQYHLLYTLTLIPIGVNIAIAYMVMEPGSKPLEGDHHNRVSPFMHFAQSFKYIWHHKDLRVMGIISSLINGLGMAAHDIMPKFISTLWPAWALPLYRLGQNGFGTLSFWISGVLVSKFSPLKSLMISSMCSGVLSFLAFGTSKVFSPFILYLTQIFWALERVAEQSLIQSRASSYHRSTIGSVFSFLSNIAIAVFSPLVGLLADHYGIKTALMIFSALSIFIALFYLPLLLKTHEQISRNAP